MANRKISNVRKNLEAQLRYYNNKSSTFAKQWNSVHEGQNSIESVFNYTRVTPQQSRNLTTEQLRKVIAKTKIRSKGSYVNSYVKDKMKNYIRELDNVNPNAARGVALKVMGFNGSTGDRVKAKMTTGEMLRYFGKQHQYINFISPYEYIQNDNPYADTPAIKNFDLEALLAKM